MGNNNIINEKVNRINILLGQAWFPVTFRLITFIVFWSLIYFGIKARSEFAVLDAQLYRTNLTSVFVWDIWWPLILLAALFFGRVWCMICPVEMVTVFFAKIGLRLKRPGWITSGWIITILYAAVVIIGITILEIDFKPRYTAYYLLAIFTISVLTGLIFEKNTFCRYVCPVGYLLSIFSRMSVWGWRVRDRQVCRTCIDKSCISSRYLYNLNFKSCGVDLYPSDITDNNNCILCSGCLKTCGTYKKELNRFGPNPAFTRTGFAAGLLNIKPLLMVEWVFLYFLTAHLIDEITEFQFITTIRDLIFQERFSESLELGEGFARQIVASVYLFFILPLFLWMIPFLITKFSRTKITLSFYLKNFSVVFIPVLISMFAGLIIWEIVIRIPYYKFLVSDPIGINSIRGILTKQIIVNKIPDWADLVFLVTLLILLIAGVILSLKIISRFRSQYSVQNSFGLLSSIFVYLAMFFITVILYHNF